MVKVVMLTENNDPVVLECKDIYHACSVMHTLENSVVGCCAFTVRFVKDEEKASRFINPEEDKK